ncbi:recombinase family protein [Kitasatospora herbaricolor]|uniref:Recombinase family protein n=1 Tax=Kitasatospora herbaricolor TaxID=68217 RepID=A0ABZ1W2X7_9ACTN|nr:recombinase family protein [Kitasatospora herbaricolor]
MTTADLPLSPPASLHPAAYLRYYPHNSSAVDRHCEALHGFTRRLGLPSPAVYLDNGRCSTGPRPGFEQLARAVLDGVHRVLIVPGPWVFSVDDAKARLAVRLLTAAGCRRILTLPAPGAGGFAPPVAAPGGATGGATGGRGRP